MTLDQVSLLIVDDHDDWRVGLVSALRSHSPAVMIAYAGPDADEAMTASTQRAGVVLALVDAHAPDGSASVVAVAGLRDAGIPVAVMSAHVEPAALADLIAAGAFGCVLKSDLLDCLDDLIAMAPTHQPYPTAELSASLLTTAAAQALSDAQRQALQWHAAGVPLDVALRSQGVARGEYSTIIGELVQALRAPRHGTGTSS